MTRILQTNLDRQKRAHDLVYKEAIDRKIDIVMASEPNKTTVRNKNYWMKDKKEDAAIYIKNRNIKIHKITGAEGYIKVEMENWNIYAGYFSPNITRENYERQLDNMMRLIELDGGDYLIMGDFNAKSSGWGSPVTDIRGRVLEEWVANLDLVILNTGATPTFVRNRQESYIDVTLASQELAKK